MTVQAQTSFEPEEGCLNVLDASYAQGVGKHGDESYLVNAFDTSKHLYRNKLINSLSINLGVCFQIKGW